MGKVLNEKRRWLRGAGVGLLGCTLLLGCSSAGPRPLTDEAAAPAVEHHEETSQPVLISGLEVRELAPGVALDLTADGPLVWTQYRDPDGRLVLELSNSRPAEDLSGLEEAEGILEAVQVETVANADRPLTRLVIETRVEAEHQLAPTEDGLEVVLLPVGEEQVMTASARAPEPSAEATAAVDSMDEPAVEEAAPAQAALAPAAAPAATVAQAQETFYAGTAEEPFVAPPPQGSPASRLLDVQLEHGARPEVRILGDGDFAFSTFQLSDPDRFVIDLRGVVNTGGPSTLEVGDGVLERVRIAQFRSQPEPVSRVVLDLAAPVMPVVERGTDGIALTFGAAQPKTAEVPRTPAPAPEPGGVAVAEPVEWRAQPTSEPAPAAARPEPAPVAESNALAGSSVASAGTPAEDQAALGTAPPAPSSGAAATSRQPSDVELYEALQMDKEGMPEVEQSKTPNYASLDVGETEKEYFGEPISFSLRDADIKEVLRTFAKISGLNMVIQPGVRGSVTVELEQVPWDQALEMILKINGLGYELEGNIMRIAPAEQLRREAEQEVRRRRAQQLSIPSAPSSSGSAMREPAMWRACCSPGRAGSSATGDRWWWTTVPTP